MSSTNHNSNNKGAVKLTYSLIIKGTGFTSRDRQKVDVLKDALFLIDDHGVIAEVIERKESSYDSILAKYEQSEYFIALGENEYLLPGMVDLHIHAPQWAQSGTALDIPLADWLHTYTFPLEAKYSNLAFADQVYSDLVAQLLGAGTTTGLYFATVHQEASFRLAEICAAKGQRGLVGKVVMDDPEQNPEYYRDGSTEEALNATEAFIQRVQRLNETTKQGVYPVVTPRFIPSCTDQALDGLGKLAAKYDVHIQSHCSESDWEHGYVRERFGKNDAFALNDFGLLADKSVMAHCNHLTTEDARLFAETGTAIAHCPISNAYFANGVLPLKEYAEDFQLEIGLGTDISGGFSKSIFDNIKQAVMSSRLLEDGVNTRLSSTERGVPKSSVTLNEAFYHATAGGGQALSLPIGKLAKGYAWDALVIKADVPEARLPIFDQDEALTDVFQKLIYMSQAANIRNVWVQGQLVHTKGATNGNHN
nr:guanine deaminase [uncultured Vagococcus sp.]